VGLSLGTLYTSVWRLMQGIDMWLMAAWERVMAALA
jgi:hypothetical protein